MRSIWMPEAMETSMHYRAVELRLHAMRLTCLMALTAPHTRRLCTCAACLYMAAHRSRVE